MVVLEVVIKGLVTGCMFALMAIGLTLVYGLLRILHVAHAALFTLGAYVGLLVANHTGSIAWGLLAAICAAGIAGMLIYRFGYEPVLKHPPHVPLIISIGLLVMMEDGFRILFGSYGISFKQNTLINDTVNLLGITFNYVEIAMVSSAIVLIGLFVVVVNHTRVGIGWRATVSDPQMALSFGVKPITVRYVNFFLGSALAAIAGMLLALMTDLVEPGMGSMLSYKGLAIVVLGGLGSIRGTLIASLLLGVIEALGGLYLASYVDPNAIGFLSLIVILMIRPQGLLTRG